MSIDNNDIKFSREDFSKMITSKHPTLSNKKIIIVGNGINIPYFNSKNVNFELESFIKWNDDNWNIIKNYPDHFLTTKKLKYWIRRTKLHSKKSYENNFEEFLLDLSLLTNNISKKNTYPVIHNKFTNLISCYINANTGVIEYPEEVVQYIKKFDIVITTNYDNNLDIFGAIHTHGSFTEYSDVIKDTIRLKNGNIDNPSFINLDGIPKIIRPIASTAVFASFVSKEGTRILKNILTEKDENKVHPSEIKSVLNGAEYITYLGLSPKNDNHLFPADVPLRYIAFTREDAVELASVQTEWTEGLSRLNRILTIGRRSGYNIRVKFYKDEIGK